MGGRDSALPTPPELEDELLGAALAVADDILPRRTLLELVEQRNRVVGRADDEPTPGAQLAEGAEDRAVPDGVRDLLDPRLRGGVTNYRLRRRRLFRGGSGNETER